LNSKRQISDSKPLLARLLAHIATIGALAGFGFVWSSAIVIGDTGIILQWSLVITAVHLTLYYCIVYWAFPHLLLQRRYGWFVLVLVLGFWGSYAANSAVMFTARPVLPHSIRYVVHLREVLQEYGWFGCFTSSKLFQWNLLIAYITPIAFVAVRLLKDAVVYRGQQFVLKRDQLVLEQANALLRLNFLKSHVSPHFLFNALNTVYARVVGTDDTAARLVLQLADLMRYNLAEATAPVLLLAQELRYIRSYAALQQARQQADLRVTVETDAVESAEIAPLLLIPFVENAFKHGSQSSDNQSYININATCQQHQLQLVVENSVGPSAATRQHQQSGGVGLPNVRQRLALLYPNRHQLRHERTDSCYRISLEIDLSPQPATKPETSPVPNPSRLMWAVGRVSPMLVEIGNHLIIWLLIAGFVWFMGMPEIRPAERPYTWLILGTTWLTNVLVYETIANWLFVRYLYKGRWLATVGFFIGLITFLNSSMYAAYPLLVQLSGVSPSVITTFSFINYYDIPHLFLSTWANVYRAGPVGWLTNLSVLGLLTNYIFGLSLPFLIFRLIRYYFVQRRQTQQAELDNLTLTRENTLLQVAMLKAQVNPHFLFNALNSIYVRVIDANESAANVVLRLAELMRYTLYEAEADTVPLDHELAHIATYLQVEQTRHGQRIELLFSQEGDLSGLQIAPLILLAFVENALQQAIGGTQPGAYVWVLAAVEPPNRFVFTVQHSMAAIGPRPDAPSLLTDSELTNVRQRLAVLYAGRHSIETDSLPDGQAVTLTIAL
jgi:two-component system, LytTR family, sensor kinase